MNQLLQLLLMSVLVAYSIFLTFPIAFKGLSPRGVQLLTGVGLGILIYLIMDIFSGTYPLAEGNISLSLLLVMPFVLSYLGFHFYSNLRLGKTTEESYARTLSLVISLGIGLQNFTEGLAIGGSLRIGLSSVVIPLVTGLTLQNVTEGFPILSPFLRSGKVNYSYLFAMYILGGTPTLVGSMLSYFVASIPLVIVFNSLALGGILFVSLEMYKGIVRHGNVSGKNLAELGLALGIILAFLVNLLP
ncbi:MULTISPECIES: ZIP family metal transporter [Metallosphaera]|uniref:Zinc/iron permease n=3 Tax=Metallosphaera TaxID=41980 RepID=A4YFE1_METS5|nr:MULTISPECIES: hypothetical protein [Metallosphaera]ABP95143.1 hypothetical protein Msed_0974 [Metallosphaera sedula DSM 5348]AIM27129.1 hypothetical protein HA72_0974 [Metallosphaera sedula]MCH1771474.1 hypothetical protein [Metallosphaera sedula]MCP6728590.1 hypothetical protein [Metallosphaera sedula]MCY0861404.1 hypothetical protein [Metallosphaera prunae]